jgi:hypothetical protein
MKKYSASSLARKKMQIKMTLSFHLKPIGMAILENGNNKLWW